MSTVVVLTPLVIANWSVIAAAVIAVASRNGVCVGPSRR